MAAGRALIAARVGSPVYLSVSARRVRLVRWGWPFLRASIPLKAGVTIYATQRARAASKAEAGALNRWKLESKLAWLDSYPDGKGLSFCTYYRVSAVAIAELRAALEAHGVELKYRSSTPR